MSDNGKKEERKKINRQHTKRERFYATVFVVWHSVVFVSGNNNNQQ